MIKKNFRLAVSTISMLVLSVGVLFGQNKLDVEGRAHITERLQLNPACCTSGEYIVNQDGVSISFFTANNQRLKINNDGTLVLSQVDTVLAGATNLVRKSDGTLAVRQYKVGDLAQGGIVFWVDATGEHGLAADLADLSSGIQWSNSITRVTNATGDGLVGGEMNTMLIIAQQTSDDPSGTFAALLCANHQGSSYGDWYLPSKLELNLLYINLHLAGLGNLQSARYWSSTEQDAGLAWSQYFDGSAPIFEFKTATNRVRAIRAF